MRICPKHGLYQPGNPSIPRGRCPACYRADNTRRQHKQRDAGRTTYSWQQLKSKAKEAAGYRCQLCGQPEVRTPAGWLDVHLRDRTRSHSDKTLTVADVVVTCKADHGAHHGAEGAHPGGRVAVENAETVSSPQPASREKNCGDKGKTLRG
jgi:hypothetical protein